MYERHCILAFTLSARVAAAWCTRFDTMDGTDRRPTQKQSREKRALNTRFSLERMQSIVSCCSTAGIPRKSSARLGVGRTARGRRSGVVEGSGPLGLYCKIIYIYILLDSY